LADQLQSVTGSLKEISQMTYSNGLEESAAERVLEALRCGGGLTGRVEIRDEFTPEIARRPIAWRGFAGAALAASIFLAVGWIGWDGLHPAGRADKGLRALRFVPSNSIDSDPNPTDFAAADVVETADLRLAEADQAQGGPDPKPVICRYHSHWEAALLDSPGCVPAAFIVPDPAQRGSPWSVPVDKSPTVVSTPKGPEPR
jgi:hypothetical protein